MVRLYTCHKWIKKGNQFAEHLDSNMLNENDVPLFILIPVLNEQSIIADTYLHFRNLSKYYSNVFIVYITTEKESVCTIKTYDIIENMICEMGDQEKIHLMNYPNKNGVMAHQLNYAVNKISEERNSDEFWIGIYNADSRINKETLDFMIDNICSNKNGHTCYQQYSWYYKLGKRRGGLLSSAALWQSRWSLTFEMPRARFQLFLQKLNIPYFVKVILEKMNYVIGHGLFIKATDIKMLGGFPENTINEDAYLGYLLNCSNINITPIPILEKAESPSKLRVYINQQATWFNGPCYAFLYYNLYRNKQEKKVCLRELILACKLFCHTLYWILSPVLLLVICPLLTRNIMELMVWGIVVIVHLPLTHFFTRLLIVKNADTEKTTVPKSSLWCIIFYFVHCWGPIKNIFRQITRSNSINNKYKTER
jgi:cellulose synthase/poly-beta-1,6-N-acetylglucosamine synthase-like glycosyltransferase